MVDTWYELLLWRNETIYYGDRDPNKAVKIQKAMSNLLMRRDKNKK